jgi:hypothetical protein
MRNVEGIARQRYRFFGVSRSCDCLPKTFGRTITDSFLVSTVEEKLAAIASAAPRGTIRADNAKADARLRRQFTS